MFDWRSSKDLTSDPSSIRARAARQEHSALRGKENHQHGNSGQRSRWHSGWTAGSGGRRRQNRHRDGKRQRPLRLQGGVQGDQGGLGPIGDPHAPPGRRESAGRRPIRRRQPSPIPGELDPREGGPEGHHEGRRRRLLRALVRPQGERPAQGLQWPAGGRQVRPNAGLVGHTCASRRRRFISPAPFSYPFSIFPISI